FKRIEDPDGVEAVDLFANPYGVPELDVRRPTRLVRGHATRDVFVRLDVDVRAQLLGAVAIGPRAAEEAAPAHGSGSSIGGLRMPLMARTICSHRVVCAASCLRPVGVSR